MDTIPDNVDVPISNKISLPYLNTTPPPDISI